MISGFEEFRIEGKCPDCGGVWYSSLFLREPNGEERISLLCVLCPECARERASSDLAGYFSPLAVLKADGLL